jgi:hypothetical protein
MPWRKVCVEEQRELMVLETLAGGEVKPSWDKCGFRD